MPGESIYDGPRLAQPDEVVNYQTGDGIEKAFTLANILRSRDPEQLIEIDIQEESVILTAGEKFTFPSVKGLQKRIAIDGSGYRAE